MGAAASLQSLPDQLDAETAKSFLGADFDEAVFSELVAEDGFASKSVLAEAVRAGERRGQQFQSVLTDMLKELLAEDATPEGVAALLRAPIDPDVDPDAVLDALGIKDVLDGDYNSEEASKLSESVDSLAPNSSVRSTGVNWFFFHYYIF